MKNYTVKFPAKSATQYLRWAFGAIIVGISPAKKAEKIARWNDATGCVEKNNYLISFKKLYQAKNFLNFLKILNAWHHGKRNEMLDDGGIFLIS